MSETPAAGREIGSESQKDLACLRDAAQANRQELAVSDDAVADWFLREIMPLEAILMHYLRHNWRNASDAPDLRQEVYARVFAAARESIPENPKRFLLTTARNLLVDLVRREQVVPMESFADFEAFEIASEQPGPDLSLLEQEELRRMEAALEQLPARQREAIALAWFQGLSRKEIAARMGVSQSAASHFVANGALILTEILCGGESGKP